MERISPKGLVGSSSQEINSVGKAGPSAGALFSLVCSVPGSPGFSSHKRVFGWGWRLPSHEIPDLPALPWADEETKIEGVCSPEARISLLALWVASREQDPGRVQISTAALPWFLSGPHQPVPGEKMIKINAYPTSLTQGL